MKNKILAWIGVIWGGLIVLSGLVKLFSGGISGGAYGVGQLLAFVFGGVLCFAGARGLSQKPKVDNRIR